MSLDQTLNNLRQIIDETLPTLELFVDNNVQPGSNDCVKLQNQLTALQEKLCVFKYLKTNKEISPSFGLHSKINEVKLELPKEIEVSPLVSPPVKKVEPIISQPAPTVDVNKDTNSIKATTGIKPIEITLNQKFQFINDLFSQNNNEYLMAIDQLNNSISYEDSLTYIHSLQSIYNWKDANENYKRLIELNKKRFD